MSRGVGHMAGAAGFYMRHEKAFGIYCLVAIA